MATLAAAYNSVPPCARREDLIARYAPLARRAIAPFAGSRSAVMEAEDMESCAIMGLIDAVDRYDAARGVRFESYATTRIRGFVLDEMRALDWMPRSARTNVRIVQQTTELLQNTLGRNPTAAELSGESGLQPEQCSRAFADASRRVTSLDAMTHYLDDASGGCGMGQRIEDAHGINPALLYEQHEIRLGIVNALAGLPQREADVLKMRYITQLTHREIASQLAISESRVSQLHSRGLARMRESLQSSFDGLYSTQLSA